MTTDNQIYNQLFEENMATVDSALLDSGRLDWLSRIAIAGTTLTVVASPTGPTWVLSTKGQIISQRANLRDLIDDARKVMHWV